MPHGGFRMNPDAVRKGAGQLRTVLDEQVRIQNKIKGALEKGIAASGKGPVEDELVNSFRESQAEFQREFDLIRAIADEIPLRIEHAADTAEDADDPRKS